MLENIWLGLLVNYHFILRHGIEFTFLLMLVLIFFVYKAFAHLKLLHRKSYRELSQQQQQLHQIQYRLSRIKFLCYDTNDKQRLMFEQIREMDDSIFELEEKMAGLNLSVTSKNVLYNESKTSPHEFSSNPLRE